MNDSQINELKTRHTKATSEDAVKNAVLIYLGKLRFRAASIKTITEHGVDIVARHERYGRYFLVEVKGDPSKEVVSSSSGREVRFVLSLGQLLTRINPDRGYYYGLAYPVSYRKLALRRLKYPTLLKKLKIHLFFVDERRRVEHLTWKDLKSNS
jgi:hypothetical protein